MIKLYLKCLTVLSVFPLLALQSANAVDPNNPSAILEKETIYTCNSDGWDIKIQEYDRGQDVVIFTGHHQITQIHHELPNSWSPNEAIGESATYYPEIVEDSTKPNLGKVCDNDGFIIGFGEKYVSITRNNSNPWSHTQIYAQVNASNTIGLNPSDILEKYRGTLNRQINPGPLPLNGCTTVNLACDFTAHHNQTPLNELDSRRVSMSELAMSEMSGQDIYHALRGRNWGTHLSDLDGLTYSWIRAMNNIGIINSDTIRESLRPPHLDDGAFIFKKLETASYDMLVTEEVDDDFRLIIVPKLYPSNGSWPTSRKVDQSIQPILAGGGSNPNYCEQNNPNSANYIPQYMSDPSVIVELEADLKYLTNNQTERIEAKGWRIDLAQKDWTEEDYYASIPNNSNLRRPTYDCVMPIAERENQLTQTRSIKGRLDQLGVKDGINCKTKDIAYYDALIERLIIVNPQIGSITNHPCNKLQVTSTPAVNNTFPVEIKKIEIEQIKQKSFKMIPKVTSEKIDIQK